MKSPLFSFSCERNDAERMQAVNNSKRYGIWYCVTLDGDKWESFYQLPDGFVQAVVFQGGKKVEVLDGAMPKQVESKTEVKTEEKETKMLDTLKNVVILSAFRALDTFSENMAKHEGMVRHLNEYKADYGKVKHTAIGSWEGTQEASLVVDVKGKTSAKTYNLVELSVTYNQDAILYIDCVHNAYICTMQAVGSITVEDRQHIGRFVEVTREEAMKCQGWTMLVDANNLPHWFIVE